VPLTEIKQFLAQVVDVLSLSKATMAKVHQNLAWAVAYNIVAIPIAAGVLLPQYDFAMTPSLSGNVYGGQLHTLSVMPCFPHIGSSSFSSDAVFRGLSRRGVDGP
jgi:hypothetical protein